MKKLSLRLLWVLIMGFWIYVIFHFSSQPFDVQRNFYKNNLISLINYLNIPLSFVQVEFILRKSAHVTEYTIMGFVLWFVFRRLRWPILILPMIAILDEFNQLSIAGRTGCFRDVLIDITLFYIIAIVYVIYRALNSGQKGG